jgi:serine/threonine protein phosphatase PrpC
MSTAEKLPLATALEFGARSDTGRVRGNNEDSFRTAPDLGLFILSDGMGGLEAGEVASRLTVDTVFAHCRDAESNSSLRLEGERVQGASETSNRLASAIQIANRVVNPAASASQDAASDGAPGRTKQMGATVVALQFFADRVSVAHVGDSRAYRLRDGAFVQLTEDHSLVAQQVREGLMTESEAAVSPLQSVLMRALGVESSVEVEVDEEVVIEGDAFVLCSDGLTRELSDSQIAAVLTETMNAQQAADQLVQLANQAGGADNVTVIVIRAAAKSFSALGKIGRWIKG